MATDFPSLQLAPKSSAVLGVLGQCRKTNARLCCSWAPVGGAELAYSSRSLTALRCPSVPLGAVASSALLDSLYQF